MHSKIFCSNASFHILIFVIATITLSNDNFQPNTYKLFFQGRKGRGSIFVFAVGNGGFATDCCSFNGLVNSIYTIAITGVNEDGSVPRYGERCPGIMAVTYSREIFSLRDDVKVVSILFIYLFSHSQNHNNMNKSC